MAREEACSRGEADVRVFRTSILMGNGESSRIVCDRLHRRLDVALSWTDGLQQLRGFSTDGDSLYAKTKAEIEDVVRDVATALGVRVEVQGELPYGETQ